MYNKKAFTLIELLAVIVILGIIMMIGIPSVSNLVTNARTNSLRKDVEMIQKALSYYWVGNGVQSEVNFDLTEDKDIFENGFKVLKGEAKLYPNNTNRIWFYKDKYCVIATETSENLKIIATEPDSCTAASANNVVFNGDQLLKNNYNFSAFTYNDEGYLSKPFNGDATYLSDEYIILNPDKTYELKFDVKASDPTKVFYVGLYTADIDRNFIQSWMIKDNPSTRTTLARNLNNGDTKIYLTNLSGFVNDDRNTYYGGISLWDYKNSLGYTYPIGFYTQNSYMKLYKYANLDKTNNVINLLAPWNHGSFEAGHPVSQMYDVGGTYLYTNISRVNTTWTTYSNTIGPNGNIKLRNGTEYVKFLFLSYMGQGSYANPVTYDIRNISFTEMQ